MNFTNKLTKIANQALLDEELKRMKSYSCKIQSVMDTLEHRLELAALEGERTIRFCETNFFAFKTFWYNRPKATTDYTRYCISEVNKLIDFGKQKGINLELKDVFRSYGSDIITWGITASW